MQEDTKIGRPFMLALGNPRGKRCRLLPTEFHEASRRAREGAEPHHPPNSAGGRPSATSRRASRLQMRVC